MTELEELNTKETKSALILRLMAEAQVGRKSHTTVVEALEFRRHQYGLTRAEWAAVLGIGQSHYGEVLSGKRQLPRKATKRAFAVGVPAEVLLQP